MCFLRLIRRVPELTVRRGDVAQLAQEGLVVVVGLEQRAVGRQEQELVPTVVFPPCLRGL